MGAFTVWRSSFKSKTDLDESLSPSSLSDSPSHNPFNLCFDKIQGADQPSSCAIQTMLRPSSDISHPCNLYGGLQFHFLPRTSEDLTRNDNSLTHQSIAERSMASVARGGKCSSDCTIQTIDQNSSLVADNLSSSAIPFSMESTRKHLMNSSRVTIDLNEVPRTSDPSEDAPSFLNSQVTKSNETRTLSTDSPQEAYEKQEALRNILWSSNQTESPPSVSWLAGWLKGKGPHSCKICGMRFPSLQALGGHQNGHKQYRIFNSNKLSNKSKRKSTRNRTGVKKVRTDSSSSPSSNTLSAHDREEPQRTKDSRIKMERIQAMNSSQGDYYSKGEVCTPSASGSELLNSYSTLNSTVLNRNQFSSSRSSPTESLPYNLNFIEERLKESSVDSKNLRSSDPASSVHNSASFSNEVSPGSQLYPYLSGLSDSNSQNFKFRASSSQSSFSMISGWGVGLDGNRHGDSPAEELTKKDGDDFNNFGTQNLLPTQSISNTVVNFISDNLLHDSSSLHSVDLKLSL